VALHREEQDPLQPNRIERLDGRRDRHQAESSWQMATGTLACPACDVPLLPATGGMSPADSLACGWCGHVARVRDCLSLAEPTRPTRVAVRLRLPAALRR
jgi:hypothetical protein